MAQNFDLARPIVLAFYEKIRQLYPIKKMILYGSYARGTATPDSDIDVAVVIDWPRKNQWDQIGLALWQQAGTVDSRLEPRCVFWSEYQDHEPASILAEICRSGVAIV